MTRYLIAALALVHVLLAAHVCQAGDELQGPYEDPLQQEIPFGRSSYYLSPWRAYMDTWPAAQLLGVFGTTANGIREEEAEAFATVLQECGFPTCRVEIGWGSLDYDNPTRLLPNRERHTRALLGALKAHGIRPLILLNAHHGGPVPSRQIRVALIADADAGARQITLRPEDVAKLRPGYTGLTGQDKRTAFPLILAADASTGVCTLSAPLTAPIAAGQLRLVTLLYHPFGGAVLADGTPNPLAQETLDGWATYVRTIAGLATEIAGPGGFDLEVWNEYTFGSNFLDEKHYYEPPRAFKEPLTYTGPGGTRKGSEVILPLTIDIAAREFPGTGVISGFANQRPWENGTDMWPGQLGFSRHYYTSTNPGDWKGNTGLLSPATELEKRRGRRVLDALGRVEGDPDPEHPRDHWLAADGSFFIPTLRIQMPEFNHYGYKTEFQTRDCQPFPGPWAHHHRYSHPGTGDPARLYMTEFNLYREPFMDHVKAQTGVAEDDPRLVRLAHDIGAKALLRAYVFHAHKGWDIITAYTAKTKDLSFAMIPERFWELLKEDGYQLTDRVRAELGPQMTAFRRVTQRFAAGEALEVTRPLRVERLVEQDPKLVFKGDGTPAHPDRWLRDDFACLPFQFDADTYVVGYYVVTRDMLQEWQPERDALDIARYTLPPQTFDVTLANVRGKTGRWLFSKQATVTAWDPLTDTAVPVEVLDATDTTLTLRVQATDSPRFLTIDEPSAGPLILEPRLTPGTLSFRTNVTARPVVTWGAIPDRSGGGRVELPPGTVHTVALPALPANHGVRIHVEVDGLSLDWPRWGHDVAGVLHWAKPGEPAPILNFSVPALPDVPAPVAFTSDLGDATATDIDGTRATLHLTAGRDPLALLPALSVTDDVRITRTMWGGADAWDIRLRLDAPAHPGETALEQYWWIAPYRDGLIALSCRDGKRLRGVAETLAASFHFSQTPNPEPLKP